MCSNYLNIHDNVAQQHYKRIFYEIKDNDEVYINAKCMRNHMLLFTDHRYYVVLIIVKTIVAKKIKIHCFRLKSIKRKQSLRNII